jgi:hypothetical protein
MMRGQTGKDLRAKLAAHSTGVRRAHKIARSLARPQLRSLPETANRQGPWALVCPIVLLGAEPTHHCGCRSDAPQLARYLSLQYGHDAPPEPRESPGGDVHTEGWVRLLMKLPTL